MPTPRARADAGHMVLALVLVRPIASQPATPAAAPEEFPAMACFGKRCMPFDDARSTLPAAGWRAALKRVPLRGDGRRLCVKRCNATAMSCSADHPGETWDVSGAIGAGHLDALPPTIDFVRDKAAGQLTAGGELTPKAQLAQLPACARRKLKSGGSKTVCANGTRVAKLGWVPELLPGQTLHASGGGWRPFRPKHGQYVLMPCSNSRGEDAAVVRSFFTDFESGKPLGGGTFLEVGAVDGWEESNSWVFEACLGWQGVLIEGHPKQFKSLLRARPASLNLRMAACPQRGWAQYSSVAGAFAGVGKGTVGDRGARLKVECAPLGPQLSALGVDRLDFMSIDVEGAELALIDSLDLTRLSVGVMMVEVRADGQRRAIMRSLLRRGMRYVGMLNAKGTRVNAVIDDVFVNTTHLARFMPRSGALADVRHRAAAGAAATKRACPASWGRHDPQWYDPGD